MRKSTLLVSVGVVVVAIFSAVLLMQSLKPRKVAAEGNLYEDAQKLWREESFADALDVLDEIDVSDSSNLRARVLRAEILSRSDLEAARDLLAGIPPEVLDDASRAFAVSAYVRLKDVDRAKAMLGPVSEATPLGPDLSLAQAKVALSFDQDVGTARVALENALRSAPDLIEAKQLLGRLLFEVGNVLDQIRAKSLARELDEVDRLPLSLLGRMLFAEESPLFEEEVVYFGTRLLEHPDFATSPFADNLEFYRVMSRRFRAAGRLDLAFEMFEKRWAHPDANEIDLLSYLDVALQTDRLEFFDSGIDELAERAPDAYRVDLLRAGRAHLAGNDAAVLEHLRAAMAKGPEKDVLIEGVGYIGRLKPFSPSLELSLSRLMLETDNVMTGDILLAANTIMSSLGEGEGTEKRALVDDIKRRFSAQPAVLAPWLRSHGYAAEALEQAQRVLDSGNAQVLPLVVDLLAELGRVEEAGRAVREHGGALPRFSQDVMGIRLAIAREDFAGAGDIWDGSWGRAQRNEAHNEMVALSHLAFGMRDYHRLLRTFDPLIANGIGLRREEFLFLAGQELQRERPEAARDMLEQAAVFFPDDLDLVNDRSYLAILIGEGDYRVIDTMEEIVEAEPENDYFRFTLALAYLVNDFRGEAMETVETVDFEADEFPAASRAIYAAVLSANGHQGPAQLVLNRVDRDKLMKEEREILEPFLGKL